MKAKCPGSGRPPVSRRGSVWPECPECHREFGAQGRKARARLGNVWRDGVPVHFVRPTR